LFISVAVKEVFEAQTFSNFFRFPMMFLYGLFIPVGRLPLYLRPLSYLLPLTYGVDILKAAVDQERLLPPHVSFPVLFFFTAGLFLLSLRNIQRKWVI
jgi:ABC-2 type transport system permease protein